MWDSNAATATENSLEKDLEDDSARAGAWTVSMVPVLVLVVVVLREATAIASLIAATGRLGW